MIEEVKEWQSRPLEPLYPIVFLDALMVKMRHEGRVENRAVYVAIGIDLEGRKEVLGLWTAANEGAKFWLQVLTELRNRGVKDIFIACVDGLKGFPQAIETVFPQAQVQIVHRAPGAGQPELREAGRSASRWPRDLKAVYRAATAEEAEQRLAQFAAQWDSRYPAIAALWRRNWQRVIPFFSFPGRDPQGDLHDQRHRIAEHEPAQGAEAARGLPQRRSGVEGDVPGAAQRDPQVGTSDPLEGGAELLHPALGRPHPCGDWNVVQFPSPRMLFNTTGCGRIIQ